MRCSFNFCAGIALLVLLSGACSENPASPSDVDAPLTVEATSVDDSTVGLRWHGSKGGADSYTVRWSGERYYDQGTIDVTDSMHVQIGGLRPGQPYLFTVTTVQSGVATLSDTVRWAPAARFYTLKTGDSLIRIYESVSERGSGLVIDTERGGPQRVTVYGTSGAQIGLFTSTTGPDYFEIGPAFARLSAPLDSSVYISTRTYSVSSLSNWYLQFSMDNEITSDGNHRVFRLPSTVSDELGRGFFVRTSVNSAYHYARVLIKNVGGRLLQGTAPDRYVELSISYQTAPDIPYARSERTNESANSSALFARMNQK